MSEHMTSNDFGRQLRLSSFNFDPEYVPLNHGSYGAFPKVVRDKQRMIQDLTEQRSDAFIRYGIPHHLKVSRQAIANLLGASYQELVFITNATTGVNTALRNLNYQQGDVIVYFSTAYGACEKTIQHICETTPATSHRIGVHFPIEDDELLDLFRTAIAQLHNENKRPRIAMFDTVATFPGVRLPFEALVQACKDLGVLSLVDGAHGVGHIDLTHLGRVQPDFFTSNCYKWLYTPRPCAILYLPRRNWGIIRTTIPTGNGFVVDQTATGPDDPLGALFSWPAASDMSPYLCVPAALAFREQELGGEDSIRRYCFELAKEGGRRVAEILGTEVLDNKSRSLSQCCFAMVRLPLVFDQDKEDVNDAADQRLLARDGPAIIKWIMETLMTDHDTWVPGRFFQGALWVRISAQTYLEMKDFEWIAGVLGDLCRRVATEDVLQKGEA